MKNLINYLSKKSLSLGNGPALDRRWTGHESGRFLSILTLFLMLFSFGVGNAWGAEWSWTAGADDPDWIGVTRGSGQVTLNGKTWSFTRTNPNTCQITSNYLQLGKNGGAESVVLSTKAIGGLITQIDVDCSSYSAKHTCKIEVGGTTVKTAIATSSWTTTGTISTGTISNRGEIVITFAAGSGARAMYVRSITVTYTPENYNVDWVVGGSTTKSETSVSVGTPPSVADNALGGDCSSLKFLGWSETNIGSTPDDAPSDLFPSNDVPGLTGNKTFYAVFGEVANNTSDTALLQIHKYDSWSFGGTTYDKSSYRLFSSSTGYVESSAFDLSRLAKVIVFGGTCGGDSYNGLSIEDESGNVWKTGTVTGSSNTGKNTFTGGTSLSGSKKLRVRSTCGTSSSNGIRMTKVQIFVFSKSYSNCVTTCAPACDELGEINGSVSFTKTAYTITATWPMTEDEHETGYSVQLYDNNGSGAKGAAIGSPVAITGTGSANRTCTFGAKTPAGSRLIANHQYFIGVTPTYSGAGDYCSTGTEVVGETTTNPVYTVTYAAGTGGTGTMTDSNSPYEAGDEVTVLENEFTRNGYSFNGWSYSPSQTVEDGKFTMGTANVTITATWTSNTDQFKDWMHGNSISNKTGNYGTMPAAPSDATPGDTYCEAKHYKFIGWVLSTSVNEDGTLKNDAVVVPAGESGHYATNVTWNAVWADEEQ